MRSVWLTRLVAGDDLGPVSQDPSKTRDAVCDIQRTCFRPAEPPPPRNPPNWDLSWTQLIAWLLIIALLGLVAWGIVAALRNRRSGAAAETGDSEPVDEMTVHRRTVDRTREPDVWRDEAERMAAAGRFNEAMRCRYRALVGDLARADLLDEIPGRTTGEERAQMRETDAPATEPFVDATKRFDNAWYGEHEVTGEEYAAFIELEDRVISLSGVRAGARR